MKRESRFWARLLQIGRIFDIHLEYRIMVISMEFSKRNLYLFIGLVAGLIIVVLLSLSIGTAYIPANQIIKSLFGKRGGDGTYIVIIKQIRLPRIILSFLVGSGLAIAGVIFQGIIRNPMVDPYVVGISAGAGTGVTIAIVFNLGFSFLGISTIPLMAFLGAIITVYIVYNLARVGHKFPVMTFLLAGVAMGFLLNAIMSFLMVLGTNDLHKVVYWLMGSLATASWYEVKLVLPYYFLGLILIVLYLKDLNLILLGEENAQYLGVNVEKVKLILIIAATLITAAVVSVSGIIGFIGLIIPHIARMLIGPDHRKLLPLAALLGGIFLLISDDLARSLIPPLEVPVGIITALVGGPYFIYLLRKKKSEYW